VRLLQGQARSHGQALHVSPLRSLVAAEHRGSEPRRRGRYVSTTGPKVSGSDASAWAAFRASIARTPEPIASRSSSTRSAVEPAAMGAFPAHPSEAGRWQLIVARVRTARRQARRVQPLHPHRLRRRCSSSESRSHDATVDHFPTLRLASTRSSHAERSFSTSPSRQSRCCGSVMYPGSFAV
jgi:hypothetical protein